MYMNLWDFDIEKLNSLYDHEKEILQQQLLNGTPWEDTLEQRKRIAELSTVLYKKINQKHFKNPAEEDLRKGSF